MLFVVGFGVFHYYRLERLFHKMKTFKNVQRLSNNSLRLKVFWLDTHEPRVKGVGSDIKCSLFFIMAGVRTS